MDYERRLRKTRYKHEGYEEQKERNREGYS